MKHGDISNMQNYRIGVRFEDTLFSKSDNMVKSVVDKVFNTSLSLEINSSVLKLMQYIYRRTEDTVVLIVDSQLKSHKKLAELEDILPFEILYVNNESEITMRLITGDLTYYLDDNDYRRSLVNNQYAMTTEQFNNILRRKGR